MSKQVQVSDTTHQLLKEAAEINYRSIGQHIDWMLAQTSKPINIGAPDFGKAAMAEATPHLQVEEKLSAPKDDVFVPRPPDPETGYPCCQQNKPCKHWQWDTTTGEGYVNTLTGKVKEVL